MLDPFTIPMHGLCWLPWSERVMVLPRSTPSMFKPIIFREQGGHSMVMEQWHIEILNINIQIYSAIFGRTNADSDHIYLVPPDWKSAWIYMRAIPQHLQSLNILIVCSCTCQTEAWTAWRSYPAKVLRKLVATLFRGLLRHGMMTT